MAHFVELDDSNVVVDCIVVSNNDAPDPAPTHSEPLGQAFIASLGIEGSFKQTSYHGSFRKQYAGIGYTYDPVADVFITPQPFPSWLLDGNHDWQPPTPMPEEGDWVWDEGAVAWVEAAV